MIRLVFLMFLATPAAAFDLSLPNGMVLSKQEQSAADSVRMPVAPWAKERTPPLAEGAIAKRIYTRPDASLTTLQTVQPVRDGLEAQGFAEVFTCADDSCGGFDFRFQLDILGAPDMHVDLGDYRYSLLRRDETRVALLASRSNTMSFLHVTIVSPIAAELPEPEVADSFVATSTEGVIDQLLSDGSVTLEGVTFASGSSTLESEQSTALLELSDWLLQTPGARVALVGHTDAVGSLDGNIELSQRRASAVRDALVDDGVPSSQLQALGAGYLAPRASNLSNEGRSQNRRVEAVLLSLEQ